MTTPYGTQPNASPLSSPQPISGPLALNEPSPWAPGPAHTVVQPQTSWQPPNTSPADPTIAAGASPNPPANRRTWTIVLTVVAVLAIVGGAIGGLLVGYNRGVAAGDAYYEPVGPAELERGDQATQWRLRGAPKDCEASGSGAVVAAQALRLPATTPVMPRQ